MDSARTRWFPDAIVDRFEVCIGMFFFFQAEDGIRDLTVTGVQTCALPIFRESPATSAGAVRTPINCCFSRDSIVEPGGICAMASNWSSYIGTRSMPSGALPDRKSVV